MSNTYNQNVTEQVETVEINKDSQLCSEIDYMFKTSMVAKSEYTTAMQDGIDAWKGDYFREVATPSYKSNEVSNFIYSTVETIRPIMFDNNPGVQALARNQAGIEKAPTVEIAMQYEWDREGMNDIVSTALISNLTQGTVIFGVVWEGKGKDGEVKIVTINPLNFFVNPMATSVEDAEYCIYARYMNTYKLRKLFPDKANLLAGGGIQYEELIANRDMGNNVNNQILVLECWMKDYTVEEIEEEQDGMIIKTSRMKYPGGRQIVCCPLNNVVLLDQPNPYRDKEFPFVVWKNISVPNEFWGTSEVAQLLSPQQYINELNNQVIDNAKMTANMPWIIDKTAGIGFGKLTNRPGLVIRKNPGTQVDRPQPPSMPQYVIDKILELKDDMESISGIYDATRGERPTGIQAGNAIVALQEAGQARIRLKVRTMEIVLSKLLTKWYSRMQQFWKMDRWVRVAGEDGKYDFYTINSDDLKNDFDISITACSTMVRNKAAMLDLIIRLSQTMAEDGLPMLDRNTVLDFVPIAHRKKVLDHFEELKQEQQNVSEMQAKIDELVQIVQQLGQEVQNINKDVSDTVMTNEKFNDERQKFDIEKAGFSKGFQKGSGQSQEELAFLQSLQEDSEGNISPDFIAQVQQGIIPNEVLDELDKMTDEELQQVLEVYPQLGEILSQMR